jgi:galactose mutarotase-like enzyme
MTITRFVPLALGVTLLLWGCGGGEMSLTEYVDGLEAIGDRAIPQTDALQAEFSQLPEPATDDLKVMLEGHMAIFTEALEASAALDPPTKVADLHRLIFEWEATMLQASEALAIRAATTADWEQVLQSAEADSYAAALAEGSAVCSEFQAKLDATADRGAFADTPWIPGELKEVVEAFLRCELFPENPEDVFGTPSTTSSS